MEPLRHYDASVDSGVLSRLKRLDPQLRVTFSRYALNPDTGRPIEMSGRLDPCTGEWLAGVVHDPAFYLWRKDDCSSHHFFVAAYPQFGHREVMLLEADLARFERPEDIERIVRERAERRRERQLSSVKGDRQEVRRANRKRIHDLVFEGKSGMREAKVSSYAGQSTRTSSAERQRFLADAKEDGWETREQ
jgi:hypothetical protein